MDNRLFWIWLAQGLGYASHAVPELLREFGDAPSVYAARTELLKKNLVTAKQQKALSSTHAEDFAPLLKVHEDAGIGVLCYPDRLYPALLREIPDPPPVLYYQGKPEHLGAELTLGMVGTRRPSAYGVESARMLGRCLARAGIVLVSGLADGLDSEAHKAAVAMQVPTVAVLGTSIDQCYPASNRTLRGLIEKNGTVVSEYPAGTVNKKDYFILRNRIIAGLSRGLLVIEARRISGTMSTVRYALEDGRDIFAVPGSIFSPLSEGTNLLIQQGAKAVVSAQDILNEYGITQAIESTPPQCLSQQSEPASVELSGNDRRIADILTVQPKSLAEICGESGLPSQTVLTSLTRLELSGISRQIAGRRFVRNA